MRYLATIQRVQALDPIPAADALLKMRLKNKAWPIVVRKDANFQAGDLVVYCEPDTVLPEGPPEFEALRKSSFVPRLQGFRIRTIQLRGQTSQGIVFPATILKQFGISPVTPADLGRDVTDAMHVRLYEPPGKMSLDAVGPWPDFLPKTEEERIENIPAFLDRHRAVQFYVSEKVDGTSATYYYRDGTFGACSRNQELALGGDNEYTRVAARYELEQKLRQLARNVAVQGEIIGCHPNGKGVAGNRYKRPADQYEFYAFSVYDIDARRYGGLADLRALAATLGVAIVPVLDDHWALPATAEEVTRLSHGRSQLADVSREGIVVRSVEESCDLDLHLPRLSFKSVDPQYLLEHGE